MPIPEDSQTSTFQAVVNRLSGSLKVSALEVYASINILQGNVFNCETIPENDEKVSTYSCGSINLTYSAIGFVISLGIFIFYYAAFRFRWPIVNKKWLSLYDRFELEISEKDLIYSDNMKERFPRTCRMLTSLWKCQKLMSVLTIIAIILQCIIYPSLKTNRAFNTIQDQYGYVVSGVYLKDWPPALVLTILYIMLFSTILWGVYLVFNRDWSTIRLSTVQDGSMISSKEKRQFLENISKTSLRQKIYVCIITASFIVVCIIANLVYVVLNPLVSATDDFLLAVSLLFVNGISRISVPYLCLYLYPQDSTDNFSQNSVFAMTLLINLLDQIVPLISLCFGSARCFHDFIFERLRDNEVISVQSSYTRTNKFMPKPLDMYKFFISYFLYRCT